MNLFVHLVLRLAGVVLVCLACAVGWVLFDAHRAIERETAASAERVAHALEALYWRELLWRGGLRREHLLPLPEWETIATMKVIAPGICITFAPGSEPPRRLCSHLWTTPALQGESCSMVAAVRVNLSGLSVELLLRAIMGIRTRLS